jgi:hypothetical protein
VRQGQAFCIAGLWAALLCAPLTYAGRACAQAGEQAQNTDPVTRLQLLGAAFAENGAKPTPQRVTAMAFLPGRGVVSWDITGKTPEQAKEAEVEAMGLADARAVQREIDAAAAKRPDARPQKTERADVTDVSPQKLALDVPAITGARQEAGGVIPLSRSARNTGSALSLKNGADMKDRPRVYAFAAVSGQAVGLNLLHDNGGWANAGLTADRGGFAGQQQAGFAWRTGGAQTSLSWAREKTEAHILGMESIKDQRVMLTMNLSPQVLLGLLDRKP